MEALLDELTKNEPLFNRVEITTIKNHKWKDEDDGKEYIGEVKIVSYYDFNNEPLKQVLHILSKKEVEKNFCLPPPSFSCYSYCGGSDEGGNINYVGRRVDPNRNIDMEKITEKHDYSKRFKGAAIGATILGGIAALSNPGGWAIAGAGLLGGLFGWIAGK